MAEFSDYIVFVDETGDHALQTIDPEYPIFGLAFCIFHKSDYQKILSPALQALKLDYWGHDNIILHEHSIRKEKGPFGLLRTDADLRNNFMERLGKIIDETPFSVVSSIINKTKLKQRYANPYNPYEIGLLFCMERTLSFLQQKNQQGRKVTIIFEGRGKKEDNDLELEFRRICDNKTSLSYYKSTDFSQITFDMIFSQKSLNVPGLQIADLIARPIGLKCLRPTQSNIAYDIVKKKIWEIKQFP